MFPLASVMNPFSPQDDPQEFLTSQSPPLVPTKRTPWSSLVPQLLKTPEEYLDQLLASTAIETGLWVTAFARSVQDFTSVYPEILKEPESILQVCFTAL